MPDTDDRGPKFRRRAAKRPDEVLDAALDLFIEKGFAQTRVEDIAARAGLSKGAIYLYFPSKEAVLDALMRRAISPVADGALQVLGNHAGDPRPIISAALRLVAGRLADPRMVAIPRLVIREVIHFPHFAQTYRTEVLDRIMPALEAVIRNGIRNGYLRDVDPELTLRNVIGPVVMHMMLAELFGVMPESGLSIEALVENHLTLLFDGLSLPHSDKRFLAG